MTDAAATTQFPPEFDKWVNKDTIYRIKGLETSIAILSNPSLLTPITELGLDTETLEKVSQELEVPEGKQALLVHLVLAYDELVFRYTQTTRDQVKEIFKKHGLNSDEFEKLKVTPKSAQLIFSFPSNQEVQDGLNRLTISEKDNLNLLQTERESDLQKLSFVSIVLPEAVKLLNSEKEIRAIASAVLRNHFSNAVTTAYRTAVGANTDLMTTEIAQPRNLGILDRLLEATVRFFSSPQKVDAPSTATTTAPPSLTLEFAVSINPHRGSDKDAVGLKPIFDKVALRLSGAVLTQEICEILDPEYDQDYQVHGFEWLDIDPPNEPQ